MTRRFLMRHAHAYSNDDDLSFANEESPLTPKGLLEQVPEAKLLFIQKYGINPDTYIGKVATSKYTRAFQTAQAVGFTTIDQLELLSESDIYNRGKLAGVNVIEKHVSENGWLPEEELERAEEIIARIKEGSLDYEIMVTHGMVMAGILSKLKESGHLPNYTPHPTRGFIPMQAEIVEIDL